MKRAAVTDIPLPDADQPIPLDLMAPDELVAVRRQQLLVFLGFAAVVGLVVGLLFGPIAGLVVGLVVAVLTAGPTLAAPLRRRWVVGTTIRTRPMLRLRVLDVAAVSGVDLLVHRGRIVARVALQLTTESGRLQVLLAGYDERGAGIPRELQLLGLLRLADALMRNGLPSARAMAELLLRQLQAQAHDARLAHRPLFRAVGLARAKGSVGTVALTDQELAEL
ncbi:hypothetical protein [Nocardia sp. NPDC049707]|uniref:hypothetical protein n=1 Tax=Nocardia sp. NPDC049707 TaxID=3154735 RepID=UPI003439CC08